MGVTVETLARLAWKAVNGSDVAFALGATRVERSTLNAIMAALISIMDGLPNAVVRVKCLAKVRNIQKWKRDISAVLSQAAECAVLV